MDATPKQQTAVWQLLRGRADLAISDSPLGVRYLLKQMD
jgi:ABC-type amino acid transport substrate-binding protein